MIKLSVVIVNFNTKDILDDCLKNLGRLALDIEVVVVDNASNDGSVEMLRAQHPTVTTIALHKNVGLAAGSNAGLAACVGEYILFLGSDAFPKKATLSGMVTYMESNPKVGIATCKLILRNGKIDRDAHRGFPTPWAAMSHFLSLDKVFKRSRIFDRYFMGYEDLSKPHEIDLCISHFMLIRRSVFDQVGKWDEGFFVFGEDVDFCYRAKIAGWKIMYLPQFEAVHYKGASVGIRKETADISKASRETKLKMLSKTTEAMTLFYNKHYSKKYPKLLTRFVLFAINALGRLRKARID